MKQMASMNLSSQLVLALAILLGVNSTAYGKQFTPMYKAEKCDCIGFSEDIPTFLSDLTGAQGIEIYSEGKSLADAQDQAQRMCVETYRNFASVSELESPNNVSYNGCHWFKSTQDGDWESI